MTDRSAEPQESPWLPGKPHRWPPRDEDLDRLWNAIRREIDRRCQSWGATQVEAEEVAAEVTTSLVRHLNNPDFQQLNRLRAFIKTVAERVFPRERKKRVTSLSHDPPERPTDNAWIYLQESFDMPPEIPPEKHMDWVLDHLTDVEHRAVLRDSFADGKSLREIAAERGWSKNKASSRYRQAIVILWGIFVRG